MTSVEIATEFSRRLGDGLQAGLDPLSAAERAATALPSAAAARLGEVVRRLRSGPGDDPWGFDEPLVELLDPALKLLYETWWRVDTVGIANVPAQGRGMIVANHGGSLLPFDAAMISTAIILAHPQPRRPRFLALDWGFEQRLVEPLLRRLGAVPADPDNARRLLEREQLLGVFPEGARGSGKPFSARYRLQGFGRGGFVEVALRCRCPIIPVAVIGCDEIYPMLADIPGLAETLGTPFVPITPTFPWLGPLGLIPLPVKWRIEFCAPIELAEYPPQAAEDRTLVAEIVGRVEEAIASALQRNLEIRGPAFALAPPPPE